MKRSALKPGKPLRRKSRLTSRKSKPKRPEGWDDPKYRAFVRSLYCCAPWCGKKAEVAHHAGHEKGTGLKPPDNTCIPFCHNHHTGAEGWHQSNGFARNWSAEFKREWSDRRVAETQEMYARRTS